MIFLLIHDLAASFTTAPDSSAQNTNPKVALIFDIAGREDGGFNDSAYRGLEKAVTELGVRAVYFEHKRNLEMEQSLNQAASEADMIIGVGFAFSDKLNQLAVQYPHKKFVCVDYIVKADDSGRPVPLPPNLAGLTFKEEEGSYLVGAMAALKSETGQIGFIGGMDCPIIRKFEAGYLAGAKAVRPRILISSKFTGITGRAFNDPEKAYLIAIRMYREGIDIIYHASGATGAGLFKAAKEMNRLAIGVDVDQSREAPGLVLTSMTKNIDTAVFESVRAFVLGEFTGGLKIFGLKENGVGFVYNIHNKELIPAEIYNSIITLRERIITGELAVPSKGLQEPLLSRTDLEDVLTQLQQEIAAGLFKLDKDIQQSALTLSGSDLRGDEARSALKHLYEANPYIIDCETVSGQGIMLAVEPPEHRTSEGADISKQAHMIRLFRTLEPVMSGSFRSVEGPDAVVIHHPIFSADHQFEGSVSALFAPEYMLSSIIEPVASNLPVDIFLMQNDGLIIYNADAKQTGLNIFHDPFYKSFPKLVAFARKAASTHTGIGVYQFSQKGKKKVDTKVALWRTLALHGAAWRLVIACAEDLIEE